MAEDASGEWIGPYRLLRQIGEGGMGIVLLDGEGVVLHAFVARPRADRAAAGELARLLARLQ